MKIRANKNLLTIALIMLTFGWITMSFDIHQDAKKKPWNAPEAAKKTKNPYSGAESIAAGKTLFNKHCKSCHGAKGLGDGPKSKELDTPSGDFSVKEFQSQTDGEIFYKVKEGRDDMPSFKKKITDEEELWSIINYVRTLKK